MRKVNITKIIFILIVILFIIVGIVVFRNISGRNKVSVITINEEDMKYFTLKEGDKFGIIDKDGNVIIQPQYAGIQIPNPTIDLFICTDSVDSISGNTRWKAINSSNTQILNNFDDIEAIEINKLISDVPYEKSVLKYREGSYYGLIDFSGKKITDAEYEEIASVDYKEGYLKVKKNGNYGVINIHGKSLIKEEYDNINVDGYYDEKTKYENAGFILRIKTDDGYRFGYAKPDGRIVLDTEYNEIDRLTDIQDEKDIYLITSNNGRYGLVKNGKQTIKNEYLELTFDSENKIFIASDGRVMGVIDIDGKNIIPMDYETINIGGDYITAFKDEKTLIFDATGKRLETDIINHKKVSNDYSIVIDKNNNYNITDNNNNLLLSTQYIYIEYFKNDLFIATKDGKTGVINASNKVVVPLDYGSIQKIEKFDLLKAVKLENNHIDLIDANGKIHTGLDNADTVEYDNCIRVFSNTDMKYFDTNGNETTYQNLFPQNTIFASAKNGKWGFINANGNAVVDYKYDLVTEQNGNYAGVKLNNLWGVVNANGQVVIDPVYDFSSSVNSPKFISRYYRMTDNIGNIIYSADTN